MLRWTRIVDGEEQRQVATNPGYFRAVAALIDVDDRVMMMQLMLLKTMISSLMELLMIVPTGNYEYESPT